MADDKPIIVIKKKGGHGGAHGGAWKIAYADFVTAMMAFFMVMWLLSAAESTVRRAIASYFRRPGIFETGSGTPLLIGGSGILEDGVPPAQYRGEMEINGKVQAPPKSLESSKAGENLAELMDLKIKELKEILKRLHHTTEGEADDLLSKVENLQGTEQQKEALEKLAEQIKEQIAGSPELKELLGAVDVKVDADGLNIEIMDTEKSSMFALGSATILPEAQEAFKKLAGMLNGVPNNIDILGHTDAKPYRSKTGSYTNWELSADRANAARKMLEAQGLDHGRIVSVVGRADTELKDAQNPESASNRRITLKLRFNVSKAAPQEKKTVDSELLKSFDKVQEKWQEQHLGRTQEEIHSLTVDDIINEAERTRKQILENPRAKDAQIQDKKSDTPLGENPVIDHSEFFSP